MARTRIAVAAAIALVATPLLRAGSPMPSASAAGGPASYARITTAQTPLAWPDERTVLSIPLPAGNWLVRATASAVHFGTESFVYCFLSSVGEPNFTQSVPVGGDSPVAALTVVDLVRLSSPATVSFVCVAGQATGGGAYLDPGAALVALNVGETVYASNPGSVIMPLAAGQNAVLAGVEVPAGPVVFDLSARPNLFSERDEVRCGLDGPAGRLTHTAALSDPGPSHALSMAAVANPTTASAYGVNCVHDHTMYDPAGIQTSGLIGHKPAAGYKQARGRRPHPALHRGQHPDHGGEGVTRPGQVAARGPPRAP